MIYKISHMQDETIDTEFTHDLHTHLIKKGYTHLIAVGKDSHEENIAEGKDSFWLIPLKEGDERFQQNDTHYEIKEIMDATVLEMVHGNEDIVFMLKMPAEEMNIFLKDR
jgi:hypothetical protein